MSVSNQLAKLFADVNETNNEIAQLNERRVVLKQKLNKLKLQIEALENARNSGAVESRWVERFNWDDEVENVLRNVFKLNEFRPMQKAAINLVLSKEDAVVIMSTGAGKSLCYQLPAVVKKTGITLVISPLLSLMDDQILHLQELGVNAKTFNHHTEKEETTKILNEICDKTSTLRLLYVTPEKISKSKRFMNKLEKCYANGLLNLIAIDEMHCCSQWGHDFRPDYKHLGILKQQFPQTPIIGLTATATVDVLADVKKILKIEHCTTLKSSFNRPNLFYQVIQKPSVNKQVTDIIYNMLNTDFHGQTGIIYCLSKKECEELCKELRERDITCAFYHSDLDAKARLRVHHGWNSGKYQAILATVAFGMGIDKPNVRFVIHHSIAKSMENYYQESGRAGRDGLPAKCIVFYKLADVFRQSTMNYYESRTHLYAMMKYCSQSYECRRISMADHFGEDFDSSMCDSACDYCFNKESKNPTDSDITFYAQEIMNLIAGESQKDKKLTGNKLLETLTMSKNHGSASRNLLESIVATLLLDSHLKEEFHFTPYSVISYIAHGSRAIPESVTMICDSSFLSTCPTPPAAKRKKRVQTIDLE